MNSSKWLILVNGFTLDKDTIIKLSQERKLCACDGAYNQLYHDQMIPDMVIGDFDSIDPEALSFAKNHKAIQAVNTPDQNKTDLEKAIEHLLTHTDTDNILISGTQGSRLDHQLYTVQLLKKYHHKPITIKIKNKHESIYYFSDTTLEVKAQEKHTLSLIGFNQATINSKGLNYEMKNFKTDLSTSQSVSNAIKKETAIIHIKGSALIITQGTVHIKESI